MNYEQLNEQYKNVPNELKSLKRWVCFKVEERDGKLGKFPINSLNGKYAKSNDNMTWSSFNTALLGCVKYQCDGIGFMLGDGIFGVDLDNHINEQTGELEMPVQEFRKIAEEFIRGLNSYSELSYSGNGIHIICAGKLPGTRRKTTCVEMYEKGRFFAFTGKIVNAKPVEFREEEIKPLYDKYMPKDVAPVEKKSYQIPEGYSEIDITLQELIDKASSNEKTGEMFRTLYAGNIDDAYVLSGKSWFDDSHSSADLAFCNLLAFWCNSDPDKMDMIFRQSGLMRDKWDENRGGRTYGEITISKAIASCANGYVPTQRTNNIVIENNSFSNKEIVNEETGEVTVLNREPIMNIDKNGEPIFRIKPIYKRFPCNDTGNAERFYEYFGELFKYNKTDKIFMFWTGKTWIRDEKDIIRKYANKFIQICKDDLTNLEQQLENNKNQGKDIKMDELYIKAYQKNVDRISNKAGKDAMLFEFQSLKDVAVTSSEFNKDDYILNTDSGIVDLRTGEITPFDPKAMLSKNTNIKVSFDEPVVWLKFLHGIFERGNAQETEEIIECIQKCLGYSLSGSTKEQCMFLCYGNGSNGKTTFQEIVNHLMGDYGDNVNSEILMQQKMQNTNLFTIAKLKDARYVETDETDEGEKLAEGTVKRMTGSGQMSAAFKYANEFSFTPKFKIWMSTNNKPIIRGTDLGIWRRIFPFPFIHTFTEEEKDKDLPEKLQAEADKILGWCIQGFMIYNKLKTIKRPQCLEEEIKEYKDQMDVIAQFITSECIVNGSSIANCRATYKAYKSWCMDNNAFMYSEMKFSKELQKKGYKIVTRENQRFYEGFYVNINYGS
ncbi:MAG: hypothetical protein IKF82_01125 [Bacilli bacterium]|nr:hypothetical protein [Bacilli bacterium]